MKVSLKTAQRYSNVELLKDGVDVLVSCIGRQLGAVEDVIDWGGRYEGIVVAKVADCKPHPDADKLSVCLIDDGNTVSGIERNDDGLVQVVCGANNVAAGQTIAWIPPGTVVPETAGREPFELTSKELRGVMSNGMIASKRELMIADEHEGILVINESDVEDVKLLEPGTPFKKLYGLDDTVLDLENKMFTHRPDCFGTLGVARELAAIQGETFKSPDWYQHEPTLPDENASLKASIDKDCASRFILVDIKDVKVADSPVWLQSALMKIGIKPLNNIVDITNYVMHVSGQPLHAYDYEKVSENGVVNMSVRKSEKGESVALINDSTVELDEDDIVIATPDAVVGLAGVMGGRESEVSDETTRIVLECGTFDMYSNRRSSMRHGLFTEAVTRFNKGQSPLQNPYVVDYALQLIQELSGGTAEASVDVKQEAAMEHATVMVSSDFINKRLGSELSAQEINDVLVRAEIESSIDGESIRVQPPFWRMDLVIAEDIVEEVGRLVGFHDLPAELPRRPTKAAAKNRHLAFETELRLKLAAAGANEVLTYNFVHGSLLNAAGQSQGQGYRLRNALSPDLQFYRQSLTPNLAEQVYPNIRAGNDEVVLFEIGSSHHREALDSAEANLPKELSSLGFIISVSDALKREESAGAAFYAARCYLDSLLDAIGVTCQIDKLETDDNPLFKPYDAKRMARIVAKGETVGVIGELNPSLSEKLKLPDYTAAFEILLEPLLNLRSTHVASYEVLSKYPSTDRDVTVRLSDTFSYGELYSALREFVDDNRYIRELRPVGSYRAENADSARNITHTLVFRSDEKTLQTDEVNDIVDSLSELLANRFNATIV